MKSSWTDVIKGKFLIDENSTGNWRFVLFLVLLAIISIAASHKTDKKIYEIAQLKYELKELKAEFVSTRTNLVYIKMEKQIILKAKKFGLEPSKHPPVRILTNQ